MVIFSLLKECHEHGGYLAYWIANTSELLYFIKQDRDISKISHDIQDRFAECVQRLFRYLTHLVQNELDKYLIAFTNPQDDVERDVYIAFGLFSPSHRLFHSFSFLFQKKQVQRIPISRIFVGLI